MITNIEILSPSYIRRIGKDSINFGPHINVIAGPNGSGKTSLLEAIRFQLSGDFHAQPICKITGNSDIPVLFHSSEATNRKQSSRTHNVKGVHEITTDYESHGESLIRYLRALESIEDETIVLLDEVETALSTPAIIEVRKLFQRKTSLQIILVSHNPVFWTIPNSTLIELGGEKNYVRRTLSAYTKLLNKK